MDWRLERIGPEDLWRYASVPMTVEVRSVLEVVSLQGGPGGMALRERPVASPYVKDYDAGGGPETWAGRLGVPDPARWHLVVATGDRDEVLGGAATFGEVDWPDTATLWDIRVQPSLQRRGVGWALLRDALDWARTEGRRFLRAETQHVNVPACRFYRAAGGTLASIDRFAYAGQPDVAHEVRLDWVFDVDERV